MDHLMSIPCTLGVRSAAFGDRKDIPRRFTCDGEDVAPPLDVHGLPDDARFLALIMDDPDAPRGTFTHWTFWDLPADKARLPLGADVVALGATQGMTDFGAPGYGGPCPPSGTHRYQFKMFALREPLGLPPGSSVADVTRAVEAHAFAWGQLTGTYTRAVRDR